MNNFNWSQMTSTKITQTKKTRFVFTIDHDISLLNLIIKFSPWDNGLQQWDEITKAFAKKSKHQIAKKNLKARLRHIQQMHAKQTSPRTKNEQTRKQWMDLLSLVLSAMENKFPQIENIDNARDISTDESDEDDNVLPSIDSIFQTNNSTVSSSASTSYSTTSTNKTKLHNIFYNPTINKANLIKKKLFQGSSAKQTVAAKLNAQKMEIESRKLALEEAKEKRINNESLQRIEIEKQKEKRLSDDKKQRIEFQTKVLELMATHAQLLCQAINNENS